MSAILNEEAIDDILYLARANEAQELEDFLAALSAQTHKSKAELIAAAVDEHSKNGPIHYAAANGHLDVLKILLPPNADKATAPAPGPINAVNAAGNTPLHWAALNGHLECVKLLMHSGADITIFNSAGHDAVFEAELNDKKDVVDWLLSEVEELENGIGHEGAGPSGAGGEDNMEEDTAPAQRAAGTPDVEGLARHTEGLDVSDKTSKGG